MALGQEELGARIKRARDDADLSQRQLADLIGLEDAQSVSNYERGVHEVPTKRLRRIAEVTNKPMTFFVAEPKQNGESVSVDPNRLEVLLERLEHLLELLEAQARAQGG